MKKELYFLRSSEQIILEKLVKIAYKNSDEDTTLYADFYGLTTKDLGLYALVDNAIAGAIWSRELHGNTKTPVLSVAVLDEFKASGIGSFMMEQFLQEAGSVYEELVIDITHKPKSLKFYEKFSFEKIEHSNKLLLIKKLEKKEVIRPTDGYDSSYWMD